MTKDRLAALKAVSIVTMIPLLIVYYTLVVPRWHEYERPVVARPTMLIRNLDFLRFVIMIYKKVYFLCCESSRFFKFGVRMDNHIELKSLEPPRRRRYHWPGSSIVTGARYRTADS